MDSDPAGDGGPSHPRRHMRGDARFACSCALAFVLVTPIYLNFFLPHRELIGLAPGVVVPRVAAVVAPAVIVGPLVGLIAYLLVRRR